MKNKIVLITGATSGIGQAAAGALAARGATVVIVGRNLERCKATVEHIKLEAGSQKIDYLVADLATQTQVRALAKEFLSRYPRLDVLVNNAGGFFLKRQVSADGIEMTFALNHLNYFLLTNLLLKLLKSSAPARVVNVSSNNHYGQGLDFNDLQLEHHYNGFRAYGCSKLANLLFTYELARRLGRTGVTANALHPGFVATNIGRNNGMLARLVMPLAQLKAVSPEEGARTAVYLACSPEVEGVTGQYFVKEKAVRSDPASYDLAAAEHLWQVSSEMTGLA